MLRRYVDHRDRVSLPPISECTCRTLQQLVALLFDLVQAAVKILCQLDQDALALDRGHRPLGFQERAMFSARSPRHGHLLACSIMLLERRKSTCSKCSDEPSHVYQTRPGILRRGAPMRKTLPTDVRMNVG